MATNSFKRTYISKSTSQTRAIGAVLAKKIFKINGKNKKAFVLALEGDLGGGKTTFLQGFARGLGIKERIVSPTFVILKKFKILNVEPKKNLKRQLESNFNFFYHLDCYRIKNAEEILDVGFRAITKEPDNIIAIEWADRISEFIPSDALTINFYFVDRHKRKIKVYKSKA